MNTSQLSLNSLKKKIKTPFRLVEMQTDRTVVNFEKDHLKEITSNQNSAYRLEVIKGNRLGYASINQLDQDRLISDALSGAQYGEKVAYHYPKKAEFTKVKIYSPKLAKLTALDLTKLGQELIQGVKNNNPEALINCSLVKSEGFGRLLHSGNFNETTRGTSLSIYLEGEKVKKGDILLADNYFFWLDLDFDKKAFVDRVNQKFEYAKRKVQVKSAPRTVVFTPESLASVLEFIETALSAQSVVKGVSLWSDQLGQSVVDQRLSLVDDPTIDYAAGSTAFDDEGFAARKLILIDKGVLKNFYADLKNASKLKNSQGGRGFGVPSQPSLTNVLVLGGKISSEKMMKNIKRGVLIEQIVGSGQDNPYTGDFSFSINLGFLINQGEVVGRIKNTLVSGNIFDMLKNRVDQISQDTHWVGGGMRLPFISFFDTNIVVS